MSDVLLGQTIASHYRFDAHMGEGTFARVYRVHDTRRSVDLAAKVLRPEIAHDPHLVKRFRREGEVLSRLQHPNIVRYYDLIEADDLVFILMDYVPGETLQTTLYNLGRPLTPYESLEFLKPLTAALNFAHNENVIHRDLKPANILLHRNGSLFVTDFGIARLLDDPGMLSTLGLAMGTPIYMAPEQILDEGITAETDIYSLGVILYQMLTGLVPFGGQHPAAQGSTVSERITYEHLYIAPAPMRRHETRIPDAVDEVVLQCLAKKPSSRPKSARSVYEAMAEALGAPPLETDSIISPELNIASVPDELRLPEVSQFVKSPTVEPSHNTDTDDTEPVPAIVDASKPPIAEVTPVGLHPERLRDTSRSSHQEVTVIATPKLGFDTYIASPHPQIAASPTLPSFTPPSAPNSATQFSTPMEIIPPHRNTPNYWMWGVVTGALVLFSCAAIALYILNPFGSEGGGGKAGTDENFPSVTPMPITPETVTPSPATPPDIGVVPTGDTNLSGQKIAFASRRSGNLDIYTVNPDGSDVQKITQDADLQETGPAWSPDGTHIAFYAYEGASGNGDIYVMNADGSDIINLTNSPSDDDRYVTWSPDGSRLAFHSNRPGEVDGSRDFEVYIYSFETSEIVQITFNDTFDLGPDWSPDGSLIAFHRLERNKYRIYAIRPDGTGGRLLSPDDLGDAYFPTWSPDGLSLAFHVDEGSFFQIYLMEADGSNVRPLMEAIFDDQFPDWSSDGSRIVFQRDQQGVVGVYVYGLVDGVVGLLMNPLGDFLPDWR
ncbi:MAG: serine/threonine-protein kinase [Anaerolineae bacterium]|nr:serine/threonine-protein kinase [Anaerolineae bacterium]